MRYVKKTWKKKPQMYLYFFLIKKTLNIFDLIKIFETINA